MRAFLAAWAFFLIVSCSLLANGSAFAQSLDERVMARLDALEHKNSALERENAALRARVSRIETAKGVKAALRETNMELNPAGQAQAGEASLGYPGPAPGWGEFYEGHAPPVGPRFEASASLLYLQPGSGNLEYGTLVTPLPLPSPNWANQSLSPDFSPAFELGLRYMPSQYNDVELNWTHLNNSASGSFAGTPNQMVGPPYEIGPAANPFKVATGDVSYAYDAVNLDAGHTFCASCAFQLRAFGGVQVARIGQNLSSTFSSADGLTAIGNATQSMFTGAGPRLGVKGQYDIGNFEMIGEVAGAALVGLAQSHENFSTISPTLAGSPTGSPNNQAITSPNATQLVPSLDARMALAYAFPPTRYGQFRIEAGYEAAIYVNAINAYSLTQVATPPVVGTVGVFLATAERTQSNFTVQGPYVKGSWVF
jgi:hypothetical protein